MPNLRHTLLTAALFSALAAHAQTPPPPFGGLPDAAVRPYATEVLSTVSLFSLRNVNSLIRERMVDLRLLREARIRTASIDDLWASGAPVKFAYASLNDAAPLLLMAQATPNASSGATGTSDSQAAMKFSGFASIAGDQTAKSTTQRGTDIGEIGFKNRYATLTAGGDRRLGQDWVFGGALTGGRANATVGDLPAPAPGGVSAGRIRVNAFEASGYGTYTSDRWYSDSYLTVSNFGYSADRVMAFGASRLVANGATRGLQMSGGTSLGRDFRFAENTISPYARAEIVRLNINGYEETGGSGYDVRYGRQKRDSLQGVLGLRYTRAVSLDFGVVVPKIEFEFVREFRNNSQRIDTTPVSKTQPALPIFLTDPPDRSFGTINASLTGQFADGWAAFAQVEHFVALSNFRKTTAKIGLQKEF